MEGERKDSIWTISVSSCLKERDHKIFRKNSQICCHKKSKNLFIKIKTVSKYQKLWSPCQTLCLSQKFYTFILLKINILVCVKSPGLNIWRFWGKTIVAKVFQELPKRRQTDTPGYTVNNTKNREQICRAADNKQICRHLWNEA